jgi:hypothetical protein
MNTPGENMKLTLRRLTNAVILLTGLGAVSAFGQTFAATGTTSLSVTVAAEASIAINTASTALTSSGGLFADYTGTTNFTYKIRTTQVNGTGSIVLQITSDFGGTGGPKVASPPSAGDALTYVCTTAASGTPCSGAQTASTTATSSVATFSSDAHSVKAGDAGSVNWTLTNDPAYTTGPYSATATFTISAA